MKIVKPAIMICAGQRLEPALFKRDAESAMQALRAEIRSEIARHDVAVGYTSATAGAEIVFAEEILARSGELHLQLPCQAESFVSQYVAPWGDDWVRRFHSVRESAASTDISCDERPRADDTLLRFNNQMLQGVARIHAERLGTNARLLLAWSPAAPAEPGSPADFMDAWPEIEQLSLIDLDELLQDAQGSLPRPIGDISPDRDALAIGISPLVVRTILFADIATYTSIPDDEVPLLWDLLAEVQQEVETRTAVPFVINTWGDAVHAAAETALEMAAYAAALTEGLLQADHSAFGLSSRPRFRIALHAGPVHVGLHPLTGRPMIYGHHVNRAARIEPIAAPGQIYASQPFVALLRAEMDAALHQARLTGGAYSQPYGLEYVGMLELPKKFGTAPIYRIHSSARTSTR